MTAVKEELILGMSLVPGREAKEKGRTWGRPHMNRPPRRRRRPGLLRSQLFGFGLDQSRREIGIEGLVADVLALLVDDDQQRDGSGPVVLAEGAILVVEDGHVHLVVAD